MKPSTPVLTLLSLLLCPACAVEDDDLEFRSTSPIGGGSSGGGGGGPVFNTHVVDNHRFSEFRRAPILGTVLKRVEFGDGEDALDVSFIGSEIVATDAQGQARSGDALVGSTWFLGNNMWLTATPTWIAARELVDGVPHYVFQHSGPDGPVNNCSPARSHPGLARMLPGFVLDEATGDVTAEPDSVFVACADAAVAKAASWGYYDQALALDDLAVFETAIRVVRADYCYDGVSHTRPGVQLLVEDRWAVRTADGPSKEIEAVWGPDGLICAGQPRHDKDPIACDGVEVPLCEENFSYLSKSDAQFVTRLPVVLSEVDLGDDDVLPHPGLPDD